MNFYMLNYVLYNYLLCMFIRWICWYLLIIIYFVFQNTVAGYAINKLVIMWLVIFFSSPNLKKFLSHYSRKGLFLRDPFFGIVYRGTRGRCALEPRQRGRGRRVQNKIINSEPAPLVVGRASLCLAFSARRYRRNK